MRSGTRKFYTRGLFRTMLVSAFVGDPCTNSDQALPTIHVDQGQSIGQVKVAIITELSEMRTAPLP
jgi:hypothetical protein